MQLVATLAVAAVSAAAVSALPPLERNIAYRSPSVTVAGSGLAYDIDAIGHGIVRRSLEKRGHSSRDAKKSIAHAVGGHAADGLVQEYDTKQGPDGRDAYQGGLSFPYGVASGDPFSDSAILWTHPVPEDASTKEPVCLRYQTSRHNGSWSFGDVSDYGYAWTTSEVDYSFKVETQHLKPLTEYYYRFVACHNDKIISPVGKFKTMPTGDDDDVDKLKIAVFSCANLPFGYFNSYSQAAKMDDVDLAVHVGDYIYESQGDGNKSADAYGDGRPLDRVPLPNKEIFTIEDYRQRYASYRGKDEGLRTLHRLKAWLPVWDDHEVADNSWRAGTADSNDTAAGTHQGVDFTERKRNAVRAYFEWMPIRQVDTTDGLRIWRKFQYGKLADLMMLDTRNFDRDVTDLYYNTPEVAAMSNDTNRSLMGGKQERWFYRNLVHSQKRGAIWKVPAQQIVVNVLNELEADYQKDYDAWDGYKANRRRMFDTIVANGIDNVVLLSGDSHAAWVYDAVYEKHENNTRAYNPRTGHGALGVEFAGTAVSSPSSYGATLTPAKYEARAKALVTGNRNLQYAEGGHRGYFTVKFTKKEAIADFWGIANNTLPDSDQIRLAQFHVARGANRLTRPINGGRPAKAGALQASVVDYGKQKWNGTAFA